MKSRRGKVRRSLALFLALALIFTTFLGDVSVANAQEATETEVSVEEKSDEQEKAAPKEKSEEKPAPAKKEKPQEKPAPAKAAKTEPAPKEEPQDKAASDDNKAQDKAVSEEKAQEKPASEDKPQAEPEKEPAAKEPEQTEVKDSGSESADTKTDDKAETPKDDASSKDDAETDKKDDAGEKTEKYTVRFTVNNSDAGVITVDGSSVNAASYKKDVEEGKDFRFSVTAKEGFDVESVKANGANAEKNGETGYAVRDVKKDTEIAVRYKEVPKEENKSSLEGSEETAEKKEMPEVVKKFLDAVDKLVALGDVTEKNAEEANRLGQAAMDAYEAVQDAGLEDYEGVQDALAVLMGIADSLTGGAETTAAKWHTVTLVPASTNSYASKITGSKVRVGQKVNGYEVTGVSGTTIKVKAWGDLYENFFLPRACDLWYGAKKSDYVMWAGTGSSQRTEGGSAMLPQNNASAYYYFNTAGSVEGAEGSYVWTFTLNYDANGGLGAPESQTYGTTNKYEKSHSFTIPDLVPVRAKYEFLGWSENKTATVASYKPKGTYTMSQTASGYNGGSVTKTLYAVWKKAEEKADYQIYWYDVDGKQIKVPVTRQGTVGETVSVTAQDKIIPGYTFDAGNAGNIVSATLAKSGTVLKLYFKKDKVEPNNTFKLKKVFVGLNEIPSNFSIAYTVEAGTNSVSGTLNLANGTVSGKEITWQVPYYYNMGVINEVTLTESGNVPNYTYTAKPSSGTAKGNVISFKVNALASEITRTITNTYTPIKVPKLEITKKVSPEGKVQVGDTLTYVIKVANKGDAPATNVVVTDNLPKSLTDIVANLDGKAINNYNSSVTIPSLAAGGEAVLTITAKASEAGEVKNVASVKSDETPDPIPSNEVVTTVEPKEPEVPELSVTKSADKDTVKAGETVKYTISVENKGKADAENVKVTDILDGNLTFESWSLNGQTSDAKPSGNVYEIGTIKSGETATLTIQAKVNDDVAAGTVIKNTATATYDNKPEGENPSDSVDVEVIEDEKPEQVTATWLDGYTETPVDQKKVDKDISKEDLDALYPEAPTREGYEFTGWGEPVRDEDGNITITAEWKEVIETPEDPDPVTATWLDGYTETPVDQKKVDKDISKEDLDALYPEAPTREGYEFTRWGEPVRDEDGNITITAEWKLVEESENPTPPPTPEDPTPENPTPEDPTPENPTPEDPTPENPTPEDPTPENPTPENPTPEDPTPENPTPENPTPEDPTPENPTPEDPTPVDPTPTPVVPTPITPVTPTITPTAQTTPIIAQLTPAPITPGTTPTTLTPVTPVTPVITPEAETEPEEQPEVREVANEGAPLANTQIKDEEVPLAGGEKWALVNFVLMNLAVFESLMLLIGYFIQTKKSSKKDEEEEEEANTNEKEIKLKKKGIMRVISLPVAVISVIVFLLTENFWLSTKLVDEYTLLMAVIAIFQTVVVALSRKEEKEKKPEEEPEPEMA